MADKDDHLQSITGAELLNGGGKPGRPREPLSNRRDKLIREGDVDRKRITDKALRMVEKREEISAKDKRVTDFERYKEVTRLGGISPWKKVVRKPWCTADNPMIWERR